MEDGIFLIGLFLVVVGIFRLIAPESFRDAFERDGIKHLWRNNMSLYIFLARAGGVICIIAGFFVMYVSFVY